MATSTYGRRTRRGSRDDVNPLYERAKILGDMLWERAMEVADLIAPDMPVDAEPLDERDQWEILEGVALLLSPSFWDDPEAIEDLYRLRKQFAGIEDDWLQVLAKEMRQRQKFLPDPAISPQHPEYEKLRKQWGV